MGEGQLKQAQQQEKIYSNSVFDFAKKSGNPEVLKVLYEFQRKNVEGREKPALVIGDAEPE